MLFSFLFFYARAKIRKRKILKRNSNETQLWILPFSLSLSLSGQQSHKWSRFLRNRNKNLPPPSTLPCLATVTLQRSKSNRRRAFFITFISIERQFARISRNRRMKSLCISRMVEEEEEDSSWSTTMMERWMDPRTRLGVITIGKDRKIRRSGRAPPPHHHHHHHEARDPGLTYYFLVIFWIALATNASNVFVT